jgi:hypothetical protein
MAKFTDSKGRKIADIEVSQCGDRDEACFEAAWYEDGTEVSQEELDELTQLYPEVVYEKWFEAQVGRAESMVDR